MNRVDSFSKGENYFYFFCGFTLFFTLPVYFRWNNSHFTFFMYFYVPLLFYYVLVSIQAHTEICCQDGLQLCSLGDKCHLSLGKVPLISGISATYL